MSQNKKKKYFWGYSTLSHSWFVSSNTHVIWYFFLFFLFCFFIIVFVITVIASFFFNFNFNFFFLLITTWFVCMETSYVIATCYLRAYVLLPGPVFFLSRFFFFYLILSSGTNECRELSVSKARQSYFVKLSLAILEKAFSEKKNFAVVRRKINECGSWRKGTTLFG